MTLRPAALRDVIRSLHRIEGLGHLDRGEIAEWLELQADLLERLRVAAYPRPLPPLDLPNAWLDGLPVYVAAPSAQVHRAARMMRAIEAIGGTVTHDWTQEILARREHGLTDLDLTPEEATRYCLDDLDGVRQADALVVLTYQPGGPITTSVGAAIEVGTMLGIASAAPIYVSGGPLHPIFGAHPRVTTIEGPEDEADSRTLRALVR